MTSKITIFLIVGISLHALLVTAWCLCVVIPRIKALICEKENKQSEEEVNLL